MKEINLSHIAVTTTHNTAIVYPTKIATANGIVLNNHGVLSVLSARIGIAIQNPAIKMHIPTSMSIHGDISAMYANALQSPPDPYLNPIKKQIPETMADIPRYIVTCCQLPFEINTIYSINTTIPAIFIDHFQSDAGNFLSDMSDTAPKNSVGIIQTAARTARINDTGIVNYLTVRDKYLSYTAILTSRLTYASIC